jgi:hypothetical protein
MGTFDLATGHADTFDELLDSLESELRDVLGYYRQQRTWVDLTHEQMLECNIANDFMVDREIAKLNVQAKLKDMNT